MKTSRAVKWDKFDSLTIIGAAIIASGLFMWSVPLSVMWVGAFALFVGLRGSWWASSGS